MCSPVIAFINKFLPFFLPLIHIFRQFIEDILLATAYKINVKANFEIICDIFSNLRLPKNIQQMTYTAP